MSRRATDPDIRQKRRENAGKRMKLCSRCSQDMARHRADDGTRLCCKCHVAAGYIPAEWHPECMVAARRKAGHA